MRLLPFLMLVVSLVMSSGLMAAPKIQGSVNYQFGAGNTSLTMSCGRIQNDSSENATGTIEVRLWALSAPYKGGTISGHVLGNFKLDGLRGGMGYPSVKKNIKPTLPAKKGSYYICFTVSEYRKSGYVITDWRMFSNPATLGPLKLFTLGGAWSWQSNYEGGTVDLNVGKISHNRTGTTGSLRLALWATKSAYKGGNINGYQVGYVDKKALAPGYSYTDVKNVAKLKRPPEGTYHMTLVLSEYRDGSYIIVDYRPSSKTAYFSAP